MKIILNSIEYELHELAAKQVLDCIQAANSACGELLCEGEKSELAESLSEYGALACFCLYREGEQAFSSVQEALSALSIDALCDVYDAYQMIGGEGSR